MDKNLKHVVSTTCRPRVFQTALFKGFPNIPHIPPPTGHTVGTNLATIMTTTKKPLSWRIRYRPQEISLQIKPIPSKKDSLGLKWGGGGYGVPYFFVLAQTMRSIPFIHNNNLMVLHQCQVPQLGRSQGGLSNATSFYGLKVPPPTDMCPLES